MTAPAFVAAGLGPTSTTTSTTIPKPTGAAAGHVLYALVTNGGAATAPTTVPSGWTPTATLVTGGGGWVGVYEHVAGGSEPTSYTWDGFTDSCAGSMIAVSGADTTTPTHKVHATATLNSGAPTDTGVTTTVADCLIVGGVGIGDNTGANTWACATDPTTLTERAEVQSTGGADTTSALATAPQTSVGATGTLTVTLAGSRNAVVFTIAVQPPQTGGGSTVNGTASATLGGATATAAGRRRTHSTAAAPLGSLTATATGSSSSTVTATAPAALGGLNGAAAGTRRTPGAAAAILGSLAGAASGTRRTPGAAAAVLGSLTATGAGRPARHGIASAALSGLTAAAHGTSAGEITGAAAAALGALTAAASGQRGTYGQAAPVLGSLAATMVQPGAGTQTGTATATLGGLAASMTGRPIVRASAAGLLGSLGAAAQGQRTVHGRAAAGTALTATAAGQRHTYGHAAVQLGGLVAQAVVGAVVDELPDLAASIAPTGRLAAAVTVPGHLTASVAYAGRLAATVQ